MSDLDHTLLRCPPTRAPSLGTSSGCGTDTFSLGRLCVESGHRPEPQSGVGTRKVSGAWQGRTGVLQLFRVQDSSKERSTVPTPWLLPHLCSLQPHLSTPPQRLLTRQPHAQRGFGRSLLSKAFSLHVPYGCACALGTTKGSGLWPVSAGFWAVPFTLPLQRLAPPFLVFCLACAAIHSASFPGHVVTPSTHSRLPLGSSVSSFPHPGPGCQEFLNISGTTRHCGNDSLPRPSPEYLHPELPA